MRLFPPGDLSRRRSLGLLFPPLDDLYVNSRTSTHVSISPTKSPGYLYPPSPLSPFPVICRAVHG